jgi:four helix bundle protein
MTVKDYRELRAYQLAFESAMSVFERSRLFPREEKYSLTDQLRRASRSVCANIAEAWRKRRYPASFVSELSDADAEAAECQVWLAFARECGYLAAEQQAELSDRYEHICSQLSLMMRNADRWAQTPSGPGRSAPRSTLPRSTERQ